MLRYIALAMAFAPHLGDAVKDKAKILDEAHKVTAHEDGDNLVLQTYQDVEPAMEYAKARRREDAENRGRCGRMGDMHMTMSIPFNIIQTICAQYGLDFFNADDAKKIVAIAKRDYPAFKTSVGH